MKILRISTGNRLPVYKILLDIGWNGWMPWGKIVVPSRQLTTETWYANLLLIHVRFVRIRKTYGQ